LYTNASKKNGGFKLGSEAENDATMLFYSTIIKKIVIDSYAYFAQ